MVLPDDHARTKVTELLSTLAKITAAAALSVSLSIPLHAQAQEVGARSEFSHGHQKPDPTQAPAPSSEGSVSPGQQQVADAQAAGQGLYFAEVKDVHVVRVLPDDTQGLKHQKWVVALENGNELMAVYNIDICDRIPVRVGDTMSIGGQYIWDKGGGLLHWLHADPRHSRPDGYVDVGGVRYGAITHPNQ